jgi:hypothetical protein
MIYTWTITEVSSENDVILHAKYHVTAFDEDSSATVETEGNWWFSDKIMKKPFSEVTEQDIALWIEKEATQDGICSIKSALDNQIASLKSGLKSSLPWKPSTFQIKI